MKKLFILFLILLFASPLYASFTSIYSFGKTYNYCTKTPCAMCKENVFPCLGKGNYQTQKRYIGFKDIYNPHDPIVTKVDNDKIVFTTNITTIPSIVKPADVARIPGMFKLYIPPGTIQISATIYTPRDIKQGVVVRFKKEPVYCNLPFDKVNWKPYTQVSFDSLKTSDAYLSALGGSTQLFAPTANCSDNGWLYIQSLPISVSQLYSIQVRFTVEKATYIKWYDNAVWDAYGDPVDAKLQVVSPSLKMMTWPGPINIPTYTVTPGWVTLAPKITNVDVGKNVQALLYVWMSTSKTGISFPGGTINLKENMTFWEKKLNLSPCANSYFIFYCGYQLNGKIKYNAFKLKVQP